MRGDRDVPDTSPIVGEEHQDEQEAGGHGRDDEEIGRHDLADVIPQERAPGLRGRPAPATRVFRDGRFTDVDPEFQQFAVNPRRAPARVRLRHRANQTTDVGRHGRSPHAAAALPSPPQPEASSAPGDDRLRLDEDERRPPSRPDAQEHDPEPTVRVREAQPPRPGALQHLQLMPQGQHFELKRGARTRPCSQVRRSERSTVCLPESLSCRRFRQPCLTRTPDSEQSENNSFPNTRYD
jgi:hypothetical protein